MCNRVWEWMKREKNEAAQLIAYKDARFQREIRIVLIWIILNLFPFNFDNLFIILRYKIKHNHFSKTNEVFETSHF